MVEGIQGIQGNSRELKGIHGNCKVIKLYLNLIKTIDEITKGKMNIYIYLYIYICDIFRNTIKL